MATMKQAPSPVVRYFFMVGWQLATDEIGHGITHPSIRQRRRGWVAPAHSFASFKSCRIADCICAGVQPDIDAVALRELDQLGVEAAKIQFMSYGTGGNVSVGNATVKAADIFKWLKWKEEVSNWRESVGMLVAVATLFIAFCAAVFAYRSMPWMSWEVRLF
jgi:hypothetical protein